MRPARLLLPLVAVALVAPLLALLTASPAQAAGDRCTTRAGAERCARLVPRRAGESQAYGEVAVSATRARVLVRVAVARLQRRTDDGWVTVDRNGGNDRFVNGAVTATTSLLCSTAEAGVYRSRGTVQWKVRGSDDVRRAVVTSSGVRKARLCG